MKECKHQWEPGSSPANEAAGILRDVCILCGATRSYIDVRLVPVPAKPRCEAKAAKAAA
jgi:uncharacterized protein (UPF0210 family)